MPLITSLQHAALEPSFGEADSSIEQKLDLLVDVVVQQIARLPELDAGDCALVLCTTVMSIFVAASQRLCTRLFDAIETRSGRRPVALLQSYQCAGWGFAVRTLGQHVGKRQIVAVVMDVDLHDLRPCHVLPQIGAVGFGVTTIVFELGHGVGRVECDGPYPNSAFNEFIHAMRRRLRAAPASRAYIPFLSPQLEPLARRLLGPQLDTQQLHASYGHCWGADPWIGMLEALEAGELSPGARVVAGSIAYSGYYALADLQLDEQLQWRLSRPAVPRSESLAGASSAIWFDADMALPFA